MGLAAEGTTLLGTSGRTSFEVSLSYILDSCRRDCAFSVFDHPSYRSQPLEQLACRGCLQLLPWVVLPPTDGQSRHGRGINSEIPGILQIQKIPP